MNIWVAAPSGNRLSVASEMIKVWRAYDVKTAIISWDERTREASPDYFKLVNKRFSWGINQNLLMDSLPPDWDACIAACDDHFPLKGIDLIEKAIARFSDCVICPNEGHLALCFPIITKGWYAKHRPIFDEKYLHNCVDYDVCQQAAKEHKLINCPQIEFEHRSIEPFGYVNTAHDSTNFAIDRKYYEKKWVGRPYSPAFSLCVKDL